MNETRNHLDCKNYTPIDVFKGLCRRDKKMIKADEGACDYFMSVKKCKFCSQYTTENEFLGICMGKTMVYPDLLAKTCHDFQWQHE